MQNLDEWIALRYWLATLLCFKGPLKYRMLCYFFVACACVVAPSELGFFGKDMHALRLAEDDEHTRF